MSKSHATGAAIDVSDGVWKELNHIALSSGVKLRIKSQWLPLSPLLKRECRRLEKDPIKMLLFGGEDYELLFTSSLSLAEVKRRLQNAGSRAPIHEIGWVEKGKSVEIFDETEQIYLLEDETFQHFTKE